MADEPEVIRQQMEQTRASLAEKLDALGQRTAETVESTTEAVSETVEAVSSAVQGTVETVQETVESVQSAFDMNAWVEKYPWLVVGGAAAVGFLLGRMLLPGSPAPQSSDWLTQRGRWFPEGVKNGGHRGNGGQRTEEEHTEEKAADAESGWFQELSERFRPEMDQLKGLAIGATMGVAREMITAGDTGDLGTKMSQVIDQITEKLGGTPVKSSTREPSEGRKPEQREESAGAKKSAPTAGGRLEGTGSRKGEESDRGDRRRS